MMEISQSPVAVDFKDMVQSKTNGLLSTTDIVKNNEDQLCLAKNEKGNVSKNLKDKDNPPTNGKTNLDTKLSKDDNECVGNKKADNANGNINGLVYEEANLLASDDIDMFAEEFLKEIEEDKTKESLAEDNDEVKRVRNNDVTTNVQSENDILENKNEEGLETSASSKAKDTNQNTESDEMKNVAKDIKNDSVKEGAIENKTKSSEIQEEIKTQDHKINDKDLEEKTEQKEDSDKAINVDEPLEEEEEEEEEEDPPKENEEANTEVESENSKLDNNDGDQNVIEIEKEDEVDDKKDKSKDKEQEKKDENLEQNAIIGEKDTAEKSNEKITCDKKNIGEDTFMHELSKAIGDNDPNETVVEENQIKSKTSSCDIISLDSPLTFDTDKAEANKSESDTETNDKEKESEEISDNQISKMVEVSETVQNDNVKETPEKKNIEDSLANNDDDDDDDDDDIMLIDAVNEENINRKPDKIIKITENDNEKKLAEEPEKKSQPEPDSEDDDCVVLDDSKCEKGSKRDKDSSGKVDESVDKDNTDDCENKKGDGNVSDDDVVLLDDDKEEKQIENKKTNDHVDQNENLEKEETNRKSEKLKEKRDQEEKLEESKTDEKQNYIIDDDIVLLDDDEKEDKTLEDSKLQTDSNDLNKDKQEKESNSKKDLEIIEEKDKTKGCDEDDDDVVLLDDEKDQGKDDKKEEDKDVNHDDIADKNSEENVVEEIFSFDTSVTKRRNEENSSKSDDDDNDDDDDDDVVLINECPEKSNKIEQIVEKKEEVEEKKDDKPESKTDKNTPARSDAELEKVENNKVSSRMSSRKSSKESVPEKDNVLVPDNSDNAQDKFPEKSAEDDNSNNDGDSFLLKEVEPPQNSRSHDNDDKSKSSPEIRNSENSTEPPIKKVRIDSNEKNQSSLLTSSDNKEEQTNDNVAVERDKTLKRTLTPDSTTQCSKKMRTETTKTIECKDDIENVEKKEDIKSASNHLLIPTRKRKKKVDLNLDFLNRFKKSITKMTKSDLEELVLQKIVEAIVHKSEFSEMRELIEKQEKIIFTHRVKINEITKQFRDLEMVHNRVLKDLETKNQQFIMPVKITRAVGLQVLIPKRFDQSGNKGSSTIDRSVGVIPTISPASASPSAPTPNTSTDTVPVKKKCSQKVTPLRPDTNQANFSRSVINSTQISAQIPSSSMSSVPNQGKMQQKMASRSATITATATAQQNIVNVMNQQYLVQQATVNQIAAQGQTTTQAVRKSTTARQAQQTSVQRLSSAPQSLPDQPRVPPMILKKSGTNGRVLTVANPTQVAATTTTAAQVSANKSVIDLTDEDENAVKGSNIILPALVAIPNPNQHTRVAYVVNKSSTQQRVTANQSNSTNVQRAPNNKTAQYVRIAPKPNQNTAATTTPRIPANTNVKRTSIHPAPLPKSPPVITNPGWKNPPPRPSIRINNIDSGIVISWTMDEMTEQHADITTYQIYAYQETNASPQVEAWRHVGDVKAMLLPMAVTLTQFQEGQRYFFAVRAIDKHNRCGSFSLPKTWL